MGLLCAVGTEATPVGDAAAHPVNTATESIAAVAGSLFAIFATETLPAEWQVVESLGQTLADKRYLPRRRSAPSVTSQPAPPAAAHPAADGHGHFSRREVAVQNTPEPITRLPGGRRGAFVIDDGCAFGWAAVTAALGVPLCVTGASYLANPIVLDFVSEVVTGSR